MDRLNHVIQIYSLNLNVVKFAIGRDTQATVVVGAILSYLLCIATAYPIFRTYKLRRQGKLPLPAQKQGDWVNMDEQGHARTENILCAQCRNVIPRSEAA